MRNRKKDIINLFFKITCYLSCDRLFVKGPASRFEKGLYVRITRCLNCCLDKIKIYLNSPIQAVIYGLLRFTQN